MSTPKRIKVSHFAQLPCKPYEVEVQNEQEAALLEKVLAEQHLFLFENKIIPDYSNAIVVSVWDEDADGEGNAGWVDFYHEEEDGWQIDWEEYKENYLQQPA